MTLAWAKEKAAELLEELPGIKGSDTDGLADWNFRMSTLLLFEAMRQMCTEEKGE